MKKRTLIISFLICLAVVALASAFASAYPDGLEWVAEKRGFISNAHDGPVDSPFPGYSIIPIKSPFWSTFLAGAVGTFIALGIFMIVHAIIRRR